MTKGPDGRVKRADAPRLAMIGPMPPPVGGTTVSFDALCHFLATHARDFIIIDTVRRSGGTVTTGLQTLVRLLKALPRCDVVTAHFSDGAAITIAPLLWIVCRFAGKPFVFRQFGGEFDRTFARLGPVMRWFVANTILRSDAVFLQTKAMMRAFEPVCPNLHWFPTARSRSAASYRARFATGGDDTLKCLFLGHVGKAKGALVAARAVAALPGVYLDLYGPLVDVQAAEIDGAGVRYRGIAEPSAVPALLADYDLLLFPTAHPGEGYSGTLVEAAMAGLPMIVTRWQSLPEMFGEEEAIFIDSAQVDQMTAALRSVMSAPGDLPIRSERLVERAADFDADRIFGRFLAVCDDLARRNRT